MSEENRDGLNELQMFHSKRIKQTLESNATKQRGREYALSTLRSQPVTNAFINHKAEGILEQPFD